MAGVKITGVKEIVAAMKKTDRQLNNELRSSLRKAAKITAKAAQANVPRDQGELARTVKVRALKRSRKNKGIVGVQVITDPKILEQIHLERTDRVFNPHWTEYGAPGHMFMGKVISPLPAQPWFRPAMMSTKDSAQASVAADMRTLFA